MNLSTFRKSFMMVTLALLTSLVMWGCGSDSYDTPNSTSTPTALIEAATLKTWMDQGLVNNQDGFENVVILTIGTPAAYSANHIPGAQLWDAGSELGFTRTEALADVPSMVPPGAAMDELLSRSGVTKYTTIVISHNGGNMMNSSRAYFTLRYWGFPKERVKVLNGGDTGWADAGLTLTTEVPKIAATSFSVRDNIATNADLRLSLGEMLQVVDNGLDVNILDARGSGWDTGHIADAIEDDHVAYYDGAGFPDKATLQAYLETTLGVDLSKKVITYCASGYRASTPFFVLDGILNKDVALYDGSWSNQWSKYTEGFIADTKDAEKNVYVTPNDAWRTDLFDRSDAWTPALSNQANNAKNNALFTDNADPDANQIENEDTEYMTPASTNSSTAEGGGTDC